MGEKRGYSTIGEDDTASKRLRMDINNKDLKFASDLQHKHRQDLCDESQNVSQNKQYAHQLIGFMYQLDVSVLCLLRKSIHEHQYPPITLAFSNPETDRPCNIVLQLEKKSIHIQIENVDQYYIDNDINYAGLFTKEKRSFFFINDHFDNFVKHRFCSLSNSASISYLVLYTNTDLDLTAEKELGKGCFRQFYPVKFDSLSIEEYIIFKDFLFANDNLRECCFYKFSQDKRNREELLKRLKFSPAVQRLMIQRKLSQQSENRMKDEFLDKLVFAVNQPSREKLNSVIKSEIKNSKMCHDYTTLLQAILDDLKDSGKEGKVGAGIIYEFNLMSLFLHEMFLYGNISFINYMTCDKCSGIAINYKNKFNYIKAHNTNSNIDYSQLFPSKKLEKRSRFSINKCYTLFIDILEKNKNMKYFIIYTNGDLNLTEKKELKKGRSKDFYPIKFDNIDIKKKRHKFLKNCSCINGIGLHRFSQEEATRKRLLSLLKPLHKAKRRIVIQNEQETKEMFLDKLIFAVSQFNMKNNIDKSNKFEEVPYNYEELREIALRWSESHEFGPITKAIMEKLLEDIKNNRSSYRKIQKNIDKEIEFARSVVGRDGTPAFYQFLNFLINGRGIKYMEALKRRKNLNNVSSILHGAGSNAEKAFEDLCDLWFDKQGNERNYLRILEKQGINLSSISNILHGARGNAAEGFKNLYDLWFDPEGNKTQYLKTLEENGINLANMSSVLSGAGSNAANAFTELYGLWFTKQGNKKYRLRVLEENEINLANITSILSGAGSGASQAFKGLYKIWFSEEGKKTRYLKTLEKNEICLSSISGILHRAGCNAEKAFKDLYCLWFDEQGNKSQCLKTLEGNKISLAIISSILGGAGSNAAQAFHDLYSVWFDEQGNKKRYLKTLEENDINLVNISSILNGAGSNAAKAFEGLYNFWFYEEGDKTQYLKTLETDGINISNVSSILHRAGSNAGTAFKDLYDLWFDDQGNKKKYLKNLEENGVNLDNISSFLGGGGSNAAKAFEELYNTFCDKEGNKKELLRHFINENGFTIYNLSGILSGAGPNIREAFEKFHDICFNNKGKRTKLLEDFFNAGFKPGNLSCVSCGAGVHASSILKRFHSICFNHEGKTTKLLDDFYKAGFRPYDLCNILSRGVDSMQEFHDFCFIGETKKCLNNFLNGKECFTLNNLCNILHGAGVNICSSLTNFHDICMDDAGNETQLLVDFHKVGFTSNDLSDILSMAGKNSASILRNFHRICFGKENYLDHFLAEKELFTPKGLSKILYGVGPKICSTFKNLHGLCFDKAGNKTTYLNNIISNSYSNKIFDVLYKKVRRSSTVTISKG